MENKLKKLPKSCTKSELVQMYAPKPARRVLKQINTIIADFRKGECETSKIIKTTYVEHKELMEFVETYGLPENYEL